MSTLVGGWHGPSIGKPTGEYRFPKMISMEKYYAAKEKSLEQEQQKKTERDTSAAALQDAVLSEIESRGSRLGQKAAQSHAFPGHVGVLGEVGGEPIRPPSAAAEKSIAEHSPQEQVAKIRELHNMVSAFGERHGTSTGPSPMQPGRQVAAWANRQHLPKAESGQGTLFAPRKYR